MRNFIFFALLLVSFIFAPSQMAAQYYIRSLWERDFGSPVFSDWSTSLWTPDKKLITVGNTLSSGQPGMLTTVQNSGGEILWSKTFLHPDSFAGQTYGICVAIDSSGNIFSAGASRESLTTDFDMALVKYDSSGTIVWSTLLGDGGDDYPTAMGFVEDTLLYLTGASTAINDTLDYLTFQISTNTGDTIWTKRYDYAELEDFPVALSTDGSDNVVVTGASASEPGNWEIATVKYGKSSGSLLASWREELEFSLDQPVGLVKDLGGNFYICGNMQPSGQSTFIRALKLDEDLELIWETDFWGDSLGCEARTIGLDEWGKTWIGGNILEPSGRLSPLIVRFDSDNGDLLGQRVWNFHDKPEAEIRYLTQAAGSGMYALGQVGIDSPEQVFLCRLDSLGVPYWEHELPGVAKAAGLQRPDSLEVIVAIALYGQNTVRYKTIRYEEDSPAGWPVYDKNGDPMFMTNRVIVRFNPGIMDLQFINDSKQEFGDLSDAITSTTLPLMIDTILGVQGTSANWKVYKIFPFLNSNKTTITSRLGEEIPMPKLWSALVLEIDTASVMNPVAVSDSLMQLPYTYIRYAHPTFFGKLSSNIPNDTYLGEQFHLWDTTSVGEYADAHIRMDSVWAKYTWDTSRVVKAGVFDSGVRFTHEDFNCDTLCPSETMNGTVVYLNKDFYTSSSGDDISASDPILDYVGHATSVAGLLGAISNNNKGISGVAGGDFGEKIAGVLLQNYRISHSPVILVNPLSAAVVWAIDMGEVDIMNNSIGFEAPYLNDSVMTILREVYHLAYRANIVTANARGNGGDSSEEGPATIKDEWGISVGASGTDGDICTAGENLGNPPVLPSKYGLEMDVLAPGTNTQIPKTPSNLSDTSYQNFGATSGAAPQVAGLAAWVLNQATYPLAVEDVERLIEYAAVDKDEFDPYKEEPSYDDYSGWGLIDAGNTLDLLNESKVIHARVIGANKELVTNIDDLECYPDCPVTLLWGLPDTIAEPGEHSAKVWKYIVGFSIDVCQEYNVSFQTFADTAKTPFWELNSISSLYGLEEVVNDRLEIKPWEDSRFQDVVWDSCSLSGKVVGYKYEFTYFGSTPLDPTVTIPIEGEEDFYFSILVKDTTNLPDTILLENEIVSVQETTKADLQKLLIWPNPFSEEIIVQLQEVVKSDGFLQVFDLRGQLLFQQAISPYESTSQCSVSTSGWPPGAYFVRFVSPFQLLFAKAIKF
ncbi:MAG: S8 family peptidase [Lewinellaceae bacterium]|nr:S8 family peptidase [Lewinellaceae bacterium]